MKNWMKIIGLVLGSGLIFASGTLYGMKRTSSKIQYCGRLRIDQSEADEPPALFCELEVSPDILKKLQVATFKVTNKNYI